ncbi:MAG: 3-beta hydroxysteroid dehydrogenase [Rhodospirillaceae bacterium BRH_c57]|nr:MAG: 3-beta hydroxysteroid dehydrogenase [Rhodospirillaceae bacterium BRH_c57]
MTKLQGKVCLLTGAAHGIGRATAQALAAEGARLLITDIDDTPGEALAEELRASGTEAVYQHHDVSSEADWAAAFETLGGRYGRLDVLVNNAGLGTYNDIETVSLADFRRVMAINVDGTFLGTQMAVRAMKGTGGGAIVNVASVASFIGAPTLAAYSASKGAVLMLTKSAATYCGTRGYGIRVNAIHPGLVDTRAGVEMARMATGAATDEDAIALFTQLHPIGRIGKPEEIAKGIVFLASDDSSFMTGSSLVVDGGYTAL